MKNLEELSNLIVVRNHLSELLNGTRNVIKKGEVGQISSLVQRLDAEIVESSLEMFSNITIDMTDDIDIAKKVAEAKAKMTKQLASKLPVLLQETKVLETKVEKLSPEPKSAKRVFKRAANNDEPKNSQK